MHASGDGDGPVLGPPLFGFEVVGRDDLTGAEGVSARPFLRGFLCAFNVEERVGRTGREPQDAVLIADGDARSEDVEHGGNLEREMREYVGDRVPLDKG